MVQIISASHALVLLSAISSASAFWRMECRGTLGLGRVDPLANFGTVSLHSHTLFGAQNLNPSSTPESILSSDCTSCKVKEDMSNYWTPLLYFMEDDGTTTQVETVGGMLAYYLLYGDNITAFPSGFQMITGDTNRRNFSLPVPDPEKSLWTGEDLLQSSLAQKAVGFNCLNYNVNPEPSLYRHTLPEKSYMDANCVSGMRLEMMFPSCWNGVDVDSDDHKAHVAFPDQVMTGTCPEGFETRLPSLFYETIYDTYAFKDKSGQFVLSNGDPVGTGYHGDFMTGWDPAFLQQAVDTCTNPSGELSDCALFTLQADDVASQCTMDMPSTLTNDDVAGPRDGLPGGVQIVYGPAPAAADEAGSSPGESSAVATSPTASSQSVAGYTSATTTYTDSYGGGIFAAESSTTSSAASSASSSSSSTPSAAPSPATTAAAVAAVAAADPADKVLYTTTYTSAGQEVHLVMYEEDVTITVSGTATAIATAAAQKAKRHNHVHRHLRHHDF